MLKSSVRIGIAFVFVGGVLVLAEAIWVLLRGRVRLPVMRTLALSLSVAAVGGYEILYASTLQPGTFWFYAASVAGVLMVAGGVLCTIAMRRSLVFPERSSSS
jgi:hypothetical protein